MTTGAHAAGARSRFARLAPALLAAACSALPCGAAPQAAASVETPPQALHRLLDAQWEWRMAQFPERATTVGDHRYDDRLTDLSSAAIAGRREHHRSLLAAIRAIDPAGLQGEDRLSWEIAYYDAGMDVRMDEILAGAPHAGDAPWSADDSPLDLVNQMSGPQFDLPQLVRATRFQTLADYRNYLARLEALPHYLRQLQALLESGRAAGWMPPRAALQRLPEEFAAELDPDPARNPLFAPFRSLPAEFPEAARRALDEEARRALDQDAIPAIRALRDYLAQVWVPAGRPALGATTLPHGAEYYELALQRSTSTRMSARQIHELGLKEVARLDGELRAVMAETGYKGTLPEFTAALRADPAMRFARAEDELAAFRDIAKRVDANLPSLFAELPRLPYGIRAMSPEEGDNAPHYVPGALDGSRAGYFEANVNNLAAWPRWMMETLFLHEGVPGHHLQYARAIEIPGLPKVRAEFESPAFSEGWALYCEGLGRELGLYSDAYSRFGRLSQETHRAARLVVDTGLHSMGWTRGQAIDYLVEHAQTQRDYATAEVDRYLVWPGQATAYKVGQLHILELRARARAALGERFDLRKFHNAVIDHGALPLEVLDGVVDRWIAAERGAGAS
jgi:uncharacterized protein (DUF885 family)